MFLDTIFIPKSPPFLLPPEAQSFKDKLSILELITDEYTLLLKITLIEPLYINIE